jgi:hypothetical protein
MFSVEQTELQIAASGGHKRKSIHHNTKKKFVAVMLLQKVQFVLKMQHISFVIRRHAIVTIKSAVTTQ